MPLSDLLAWLTPALASAAATGMVMLLKWQRATTTHVAILRRDVEALADGAALEAVQEAHQALAARMARLEADMPAPEAASRIHQRLDDLNSTVSHVEGELKQLNRSIHLIQEHLLNKP